MNINQRINRSYAVLKHVESEFNSLGIPFEPSYKISQNGEEIVTEVKSYREGYIRTSIITDDKTALIALKDYLANRKQMISNFENGNYETLRK